MNKNTNENNKQNHYIAINLLSSPDNLNIFNDQNDINNNIDNNNIYNQNENILNENNINNDILDEINLIRNRLIFFKIYVGFGLSFLLLIIAIFVYSATK